MISENDLDNMLMSMPVQQIIDMTITNKEINAYVNKGGFWCRILKRDFKVIMNDTGEVCKEAYRRKHIGVDQAEFMMVVKKLSDNRKSFDTIFQHHNVNVKNDKEDNLLFKVDHNTLDAFIEAGFNFNYRNKGKLNLRKDQMSDMRLLHVMQQAGLKLYSSDITPESLSLQHQFLLQRKRDWEVKLEKSGVVLVNEEKKIYQNMEHDLSTDSFFERPYQSFLKEIRGTELFDLLSKAQYPRTQLVMEFDLDDIPFIANNKSLYNSVDRRAGRFDKDKSLLVHYENDMNKAKIMITEIENAITEAKDYYNNIEKYNL